MSRSTWIATDSLQPRNRPADAAVRMETLLAPDHVWKAAVAMSVVALGRAGRSLLDQARRGSREARDEVVWTDVSTAARRMGMAGPPSNSTTPDHEQEKVVMRALQHPRTRSLHSTR